MDDVGFIIKYCLKENSVEPSLFETMIKTRQGRMRGRIPPPHCLSSARRSSPRCPPPWSGTPPPQPCWTKIWLKQISIFAIFLIPFQMCSGFSDNLFFGKFTSRCLLHPGCRNHMRRVLLEGWPAGFEWENCFASKARKGATKMWGATSVGKLEGSDSYVS